MAIEITFWSDSGWTMEIDSCISMIELVSFLLIALFLNIQLWKWCGDALTATQNYVFWGWGGGKWDISTKKDHSVQEVLNVCLE